MAHSFIELDKAVVHVISLVSFLRLVFILSDLSTMTRLSWVALRGMAHHFIELDKAVVHVIRLVSFL